MCVCSVCVFQLCTRDPNIATGELDYLYPGTARVVAVLPVVMTVLPAVCLVRTARCVDVYFVCSKFC